MKSTSVLIVEDELLIAEQLKKRLAKLGYAVTDIVTNTVDVIRSLREKPADIVLMDIVIEGDSDGIDAAVQVQNEFKLPVIFLTAYTDDETLRRAELSRAYGYLVKPVQERELNAMMRIVLNRHSRDRELLSTIADVEALGQALGLTVGRLSKQVVDYDLVKLEDELKFALERQQFEIYYQPQVSVEQQRIVGAEALIRWNHPTKGVISPTVFIPTLEETGMINEVGEWVLDGACKQLKSWLELKDSDLCMSVNLSSKQITPGYLEKTISDSLLRYELMPESLDLEVTESLLVGKNDYEISLLHRIKQLGVQLSVDDFGTGYSGLNYLQKMPFDKIKIDREFIHNISKDNKYTAIVMAIIRLAKDLDLQIIAEGVENDSELEFLRANDCDVVQGFYFSPPLQAADFGRLLLDPKKLFD